MVLTSLDLSFISALIQWDSHCQDCNFTHVVNYSLEFYGAQRLNGYMGHVPSTEGTTNKKRWSWRHEWRWRTGQRESWSLPALYKYLMKCLETWPVSLRVKVIQSWGWWVSMMPLMLPHCLFTDKESLQTHQQHRAEAMQPRINHLRQKFRQANTDFI